MGVRGALATRRGPHSSVLLFPNRLFRVWPKSAYPWASHCSFPGDRIDDTRSESAAAAVVLGGIGIFARPVDGGASLATAVMVGDRGRGLRLRASWFLPKRAWLAKALSLGAWFLLGAFLIQVRGQRPDELHQDDTRTLALADGRPVILTARVMREGYARAAGPRSVRESIDVETEEIASAGESRPLRTGVRLTIYEKVENSESVERRAASPSLDAADGADGTRETPVSPLALTYGTRLRIRAKLHPARNYRNPGAFDYEGYLRDNGISVLGSAEATAVSN